MVSVGGLEQFVGPQAGEPVFIPSTRTGFFEPVPYGEIPCASPFLKLWKINLFKVICRTKNSRPGFFTSV